MVNVCFNWFDVFALFGGFLALLLGCIFLFNEKFKTKSNIALAISLFSLFLLILRNILGNQLPYHQDNLIYYLPFFYGLLLPLGFYYSVIYLLNPDYQYQPRDYWFLLPLGIMGVMDTILLFLYLFQFDFFRTNPNAIIYYGDYFFNLLVLVYFLITLILCWKKVNAYQKELLNNYSLIEGKDLQWLRNSIVLTWILLIAFIALRISVSFYPSYTNLTFYLLWLLATGFVCLIAFKVIINQNYYLISKFKRC